MAITPAKSATLQSLALGPAALEQLRPVLQRVTRVAKAVCSARTVEAVLFDGEAIWRASVEQSHGDCAPVSGLAREAGEVVWIPDLQRDPRFRDLPAFAQPRTRGYMGAAIRLESGERIGALGVYFDAPLSFRKEQAGLLQDLADLAGFECDRVRFEVDRDAMIGQLRGAARRLSAKGARAA